MKVGIVMGSDSDFPVVEKALAVFKEFDVEVECRVLSAHRTPDQAADFAKSAEERGLSVILGFAGMAAHLPGVLAAMTTLPVIGVPVVSGALQGMDAMLAMVQMPPGIPVATVAINGGKNAAILAIQMMALKSDDLREKLHANKAEQAAAVLKKDQMMQDRIKG
jgi:5-(carboxyamino)imidazole ribonucleotide mutase